MFTGKRKGGNGEREWNIKNGQQIKSDRTGKEEMRLNKCNERENRM